MYYFFLGNTPDLSLLELQTLYPGEFKLVGKEIASFDGELISLLCQTGRHLRKVAQALAVVNLAKLTDN
jgi:hypothetical protein